MPSTNLSELLKEAKQYLQSGTLASQAQDISNNGLPTYTGMLEQNQIGLLPPIQPLLKESFILKKKVGDKIHGQKQIQAVNKAIEDQENANIEPKFLTNYKDFLTKTVDKKYGNNYQGLGSRAADPQYQEKLNKFVKNETNLTREALDFNKKISAQEIKNAFINSLQKQANIKTNLKNAEIALFEKLGNQQQGIAALAKEADRINYNTRANKPLDVREKLWHEIEKASKLLAPGANADINDQKIIAADLAKSLAAAKHFESTVIDPAEKKDDVLNIAPSSPELQHIYDIANSLELGGDQESKNYRATKFNNIKDKLNINKIVSQRAEESGKDLFTALDKEAKRDLLAKISAINLKHANLGSSTSSAKTRDINKATKAALRSLETKKQSLYHNLQKEELSRYKKEIGGDLSDLSDLKKNQYQEGERMLNRVNVEADKNISDWRSSQAENIEKFLDYQEEESKLWPSLQNLVGKKGVNAAIPSQYIPLLKKLSQISQDPSVIGSLSGAYDSSQPTISESQRNKSLTTLPKVTAEIERRTQRERERENLIDNPEMLSAFDAETNRLFNNSNREYLNEQTNQRNRLEQVRESQRDQLRQIREDSALRGSAGIEEDEPAMVEQYQETPYEAHKLAIHNLVADWENYDKKHDMLEGIKIIDSIKEILDNPDDYNKLINAINSDRVAKAHGERYRPQNTEKEKEEGQILDKYISLLKDLYVRNRDSGGLFEEYGLFSEANKDYTHPIKDDTGKNLTQFGGQLFTEIPTVLFDRFKHG